MEQAGCMHESMEITLNPFDMGPAGRYTVRTVSRGNNGGYPLDIKNISIGKQLLFFSALVFITMGIVMIVFTNYSMRKQAINEAEKKALLLLDRNLSTHSYFSHRLKPRLFEITDEIKPEGYFEPVWMSSTYAVREIDKYFQSLSDIRYYYKECAINARSPENEADAFESEFITKLNTDSGLKMASGTRIFDGVINFYVLRRGEVMGDTCLRCHSTPDVAPQEMVLQYGLERSFKRELGETVSAISIRIPLAAAYKDVNAVSAVISVVLIIVLLIIFIIQYRLTRRILVEPVEVIRTKALSVANNSKNIGEQIHHTAGKELAELISAFNAMSLNLKKHADHLEDMVDERTHELSTVNEKLRREIEGHHQTEAALKKEKDKLAEALAKVKTLSGLVPICSQCKKVRDDKGYWNQIETYIETHTDALFSHGLCSECGDKLYGEQEWFKKKKRRENKNK